MKELKLIITLQQFLELGGTLETLPKEIWFSDKPKYMVSNVTKYNGVYSYTYEYGHIDDYTGKDLKMECICKVSLKTD